MSDHNLPFINHDFLKDKTDSFDYSPVITCPECSRSIALNKIFAFPNFYFEYDVGVFYAIVQCNLCNFIFFIKQNVSYLNFDDDYGREA